MTIKVANAVEEDVTNVVMPGNTPLVDLTCASTVCPVGHTPVQKPEGCTCRKSRPSRRRIAPSGFNPITTTMPPTTTVYRPSSYPNNQAGAKRKSHWREADKKAVEYLTWLHKFTGSRRRFRNSQLHILG